VAGIMTDNTAVQKGGHHNKEVNRKMWKAVRGNPSKQFDRRKAGDTLKSIADDYGISMQAVHQYLLRVDDKAYKDAREIAGDAFATEMLRVASDDTIEPSRARNVINSTQFLLERRYKTYQRTEKLEVTHNDITNRLASGRKRLSNVIDAETVETKAIE